MEQEKQYTMSALKADIEQMKRDNKRDQIETRIQTIGLLLVFFFGIATFADFKTKVKNGI